MLGQSLNMHLKVTVKVVMFREGLGTLSSA